MSNVLRFELSEFRKWNERKTETKGVWSVASCPALDREVRTVKGSPNGKLARKLLAEFDLDPNTPVEVWRGDTLCFHSTPLSSWAGITVDEGENSACFRPWKPFSEAPPQGAAG